MASVLKVDKLDPQSGTALEIGTSGDTISVPSGATLDISASTLTPPATMPASSAANLTNIPGANITGTIAAVSGANLTSLTATNLGSGTVPTARLGSGTASSSTVLYGDQTYKAEPGGGKILQVVQNVTSSNTVWTGSSAITTLTDQNVVITPSSTDSKILVSMECGGHVEAASNGQISIYLQRSISGGADSTIVTQVRFAYKDGTAYGNVPMSLFMQFLDSPSTTSETTYYWRLKGETAASGFSMNYGGSTNAGRFIAMEVDGS